MKERLKITLMLFLSISLFSCATTRLREDPYRPRYKKIAGSFDEVWEASLLALKNYTLPEVSRDTGTIKTEWVDTIDRRYFDLIGGDRVAKKARKRMIVRVFRSRAFSSKVRITKQFQVYSGFFQGWEERPAEEVEPQVLLHRIERLIYLNKLREKAQAR